MRPKFGAYPTLNALHLDMCQPKHFTLDSPLITSTARYIWMSANPSLAKFHGLCISGCVLRLMGVKEAQLTREAEKSIGLVFYKAMC